MPWDSLSLHFAFAMVADVVVRVCILVVKVGSRFVKGN